MAKELRKVKGEVQYIITSLSKLWHILICCCCLTRVPKRRTASDYYEVVSTPIDLLKIQQKVKTDSYDYVDQLSADIMLMVNNAKAYYQVPIMGSYWLD